MNIQATQLSISEAVDGDYVQILLKGKHRQSATRHRPEQPYLLLQRSFEMPGPYYLECPNHDLCGFGHIERLLLKKSGIDIYINRSDLSPNQRIIHVYYEFTGSELVEVKKMLITIVSGYQCFVDET